jgi:hypothetical protein
MNNGVVRISRKGTKKFAFGEEGQPFEVDVVAAFQGWIDVDKQFRVTEDSSLTDLPAYHQAAVIHVKNLSGYDVTIAEALDFMARLREVYDDLAVFFRPRSPEERGSPGTSAVASAGTSAKTELRFSAETG